MSPNFSFAFRAQSGGEAAIVAHCLTLSSSVDLFLFLFLFLTCPSSSFVIGDIELPFVLLVLMRDGEGAHLNFSDEGSESEGVEVETGCVTESTRLQK